MAGEEWLELKPKYVSAYNSISFFPPFSGFNLDSKFPFIEPGENSQKKKMKEWSKQASGWRAQGSGASASSAGEPFNLYSVK